MAAQPVSSPGRAALPRVKLVKRAGRDRSQTLRRAFQFAFLALNVWIGVEFYFFVRYYETAGRTTFFERSPGVEGWLPIAALMNLKALLLTGQLPAVHPAGLFLLLAFLGMSLVFRKAFCGWICPVGTVSELLYKVGRRVFGRNFHLPRRADVPLRSLKYILLALFLYAVVSMPAASISAFLEGPYGLIADVKMLNFFRYLGMAGAAVVGSLVVLSLVVPNFWCRYLCPYGALMGLAALASPARIQRVKESCIDCAKCAKACPARLPVDSLVTIRSAECTACLECVAACPAEGALQLGFPGRRKLPAWTLALGLACIFLGIGGYARVTGHWRTNLPERVYFELIPHAQEFSHP